MTDFNATAELVRRSGTMVRDFLALGDELKAIGSIDQARQEMQAELDRVTAEGAAKQAEIDTATTEYAIFLANRDLDMADHRATCEQIIMQSRQAAAEIVLNANLAAKDVLDAANTEVARVQAGQAEAMKAAAAEFLAATAARDAVLRETEAARADHDALAQSIQGMRKLARTALEGTVAP